MDMYSLNSDRLSFENINTLNPFMIFEYKSMFYRHLDKGI